MTTSLHPTPSRQFLRHGMLPQLAAFEAVIRRGTAPGCRHGASGLTPLSTIDRTKGSH